MEQQATPKSDDIKWYHKILPFRLRVLYVCPTQELHEVSAWFWFGYKICHSDRAICPLAPIVGMLYGFQPEPVPHLNKETDLALN